MDLRILGVILEDQLGSLPFLKVCWCRMQQPQLIKFCYFCEHVVSTSQRHRIVEIIVLSKTFS